MNLWWDDGEFVKDEWNEKTLSIVFDGNWIVFDKILCRTKSLNVSECFHEQSKQQSEEIESRPKNHSQCEKRGDMMANNHECHNCQTTITCRKTRGSTTKPIGMLQCEVKLISCVCARDCSVQFSTVFFPVKKCATLPRVHIALQSTLSALAWRPVDDVPRQLREKKKAAKLFHRNEAPMFTVWQGS